MIREFRPLTVGGLFDAFLRVLFNKDSMKLIGIYLGVSLPLLAVGIIAFSQTFFKIMGLLIPTADFSQLEGSDANGLIPPLLLVAIVPVYAFVALLYTLMATDLYGKRFFETPYRFLASGRGLVKRIPGLLLVVVLSYAYFSSFSFIGSIFITVLSAVSITANDPLIVLILVLCFVLFFLVVMEAAGVFVCGTVPAMTIDGKGVFKSIGASFKLFTKGYFRVYGACLLFRLLMFIGSLFLTFALIFLTGEILSSVRIPEGQTATLVLTLVLSAYGFLFIIMSVTGNAFQAVLYCNQKIKNEGLGAELLVRRFLEENPSPEGGRTSP